MLDYRGWFATPATLARDNYLSTLHDATEVMSDDNVATVLEANVIDLSL